MNWQSWAEALIDENLERLRDSLSRDALDGNSLAGARIALRALSCAFALSAHEPKIRAREAADISALGVFATDSRPQDPSGALARLIRSDQLSLDSAAALRLHDALLRATAARLRLVNPRYITARQRRAESSY
jgi:hypothetical protein